MFFRKSSSHCWIIKSVPRLGKASAGQSRISSSVSAISSLKSAFAVAILVDQSNVPFRPVNGCRWALLRGPQTHAQILATQRSLQESLPIWIGSKTPLQVTVIELDQFFRNAIFL